MAKYVRVNFDCGYNVGDNETIHEYSNDWTDNMIDNDLQELFYEWANDYAYLESGWDTKYTDEELNNWLESRAWTWNYITKDEYNKFLEQE